jgi:hypothetical protein
LWAKGFASEGRVAKIQPKEVMLNMSELFALIFSGIRAFVALAEYIEKKIKDKRRPRD